MLLIDFFDQVYMPRRLRGKSENSVRLYRLCVRQFGVTLGRAARVSDLTEENILKHLARRSQVAPATRNKELAELNAMWRLAVQRGLHTGWPDVQPECEPEAAPIAWLADEVHRILAACKRQDGEITGIPSSVWWESLVRLILDSGERISAVRQARWSWLQDEWLRVPASARKGKTRDRCYRLSSQTLAVLARLHAYRSDDRMLPWDLSETYLWRKYGRLIESAGLPSGRKFGFHALRKTVGSAVFAAGHDPQDALDHSDRRTTQAYLDPRFARERSASDILAEFLRNPRRDPPEQRETA